jgi:hypothetical protein
MSKEAIRELLKARMKREKSVAFLKGLISGIVIGLSIYGIYNLWHK